MIHSKCVPSLVWVEFCFHSCDRKYSRFDSFPCILECCFPFSLLSIECVCGGGGVSTFSLYFQNILLRIFYKRVFAEIFLWKICFTENTHTQTHTYLHISTYMGVFACVCVCVCDSGAYVSIHTYTHIYTMYVFIWSWKNTTFFVAIIWNICMISYTHNIYCLLSHPLKHTVLKG